MPSDTIPSPLDLQGDYQTAVWSFFRYEPSARAAIAASVLFGCATSGLAIRTYTLRLRYFSIFVLGGCFEVVGYVGRIFSAYESPNWKIPPFVVQGVFLLVAPALCAASMYMALDHIVRQFDARHLSLKRASPVTLVFVSGDIVALVLQAVGASVITCGTLHYLSLGTSVTLAGLAFQIASLAAFISTAGFFHYRMTRTRNDRVQRRPAGLARQMAVLYTASVLIFIRSVFRFAEYADGNDGFLMRNEVYLYLLDGLLMLIVMTLYIVYPPRQIVMAPVSDSQASCAGSRTLHALSATPTPTSTSTSTSPASSLSPGKNADMDSRNWGKDAREVEGSEA